MMFSEHRRPGVQLDDYEPFIGPRAIERIRRKARRFRDHHLLHISSTYYGGGVAAKLAPLVMLMNDVGIRAGWRIIQGDPDFFSITKGMHNALQGSPMDLTDQMKATYEQINFENALRNYLRTQDFVVVHDPQPLPLIKFYDLTMPWIWRCHIDLTNPDARLWAYLRRFIDKYHAVIVSMPEYAHDMNPPQFFHSPAIDPFSLTNRDLTDQQVTACLAKHPDIPMDLPLIVQVSRFDKWKDPQGVIDAFKLARKHVDCTLVLLGSAATDDPEGDVVYRSLLDQREDRIVIINQEDSMLVNILQRRAAIVLQKSLREGFGLTVAEAMWKGTPVIGGNVGGIRYQIRDGANGFLVSSVPETTDRIVQLLRDPDLRTRMGQAGRDVVRKNFLITHALEFYIDLMSTFEVAVRVKPTRLPHREGGAASHPNEPSELEPAHEHAI